MTILWFSSKVMFSQCLILKNLRSYIENLESLNVDIKSLGERRTNKQQPPNLQTDQANTKSKTDDQFTVGDELGFEEGFESDGDGWGEDDETTVIEEVSSLINARRTRGTQDGIVIDKWLDPLPKETELEDYKKLILNDDTLVGQMVGKRGKHSLILLRANFMSEDDTILVNQKITEIAMSYHDPQAGFDVKISGMPELNGTLKNSLLGTLRILLILSVILMLSMLTYQFRHIIGVVPPIIVVGMAALNTFASMSIFGMPVTML